MPLVHPDSGVFQDAGFAGDRVADGAAADDVGRVDRGEVGRDLGAEGVHAKNDGARFMLLAA